MISSIDDPLQVALQTAQVLSQVIEGWDPEQIQLAQVLHECIQVFENLLSAISCPARTLEELDPSSGSIKRQQLESEDLKEIKGILEDLLLGKHKGDLKVLSGKLASKIKLCVSKAHDNVDSALEAIQYLNKPKTSLYLRLKNMTRKVSFEGSTLEDLKAVFCEKFPGWLQGAQNERLMIWEKNINQYYVLENIKDLMDGSLLTVHQDAFVSNAATQTGIEPIRLDSIKSYQNDLSRTKSSVQELIAMFSDFTREFNSLLPESDSTVKKEDPAPESVHSISESLSMQEKCYKELARFVDKLRLELVQFRVRPGVRRSARLHDESQVLADEIHRIKAKLEKCDEMLEEDSDLKKDLDARITSLLQDQSELHNVIVMIQEVVTIQEGSKEIEVPYFHTISAEELQTTKARPFMDELVIKTQCFTSQERMETFDKYMDLRNWEKQFFHFETDFKKELKKSVKDRVNPMGSIWRLEQYRRQKDTKLRLNLFREERQLFNL